MQWTSAITPGPHNLTEHQIDAIDSLGRHYLRGKFRWQTWRALKRKGLTSDELYLSPRGKRRFRTVLTDAGKIELARIQAEASAYGY